MKNLIPIIGILSTIALPIGLGMYIAIRALNTKHKERMALIKQGLVPPEETKAKPNKYRSLRNGILCVGIALGLIISFTVSYSLGLGEDQTFLVVASGVLLFLGLGYILFYLLIRNKEEYRDQDE